MPPTAEISGATSAFISHSFQDTKFTKRLAADLVERGFHAQTFHDIVPPETLLNKQKLHPALVSAIESASYFVPVLSPAFVESKWVNLEIDAALRAHRRKQEIGVLPVLLRECELPTSLGLRTPSVFTSSYEVGLEDLIARMSAPRLSVSEEQERTFEASEVAASEIQQYLSTKRDDLDKLSPMQFEKLIAEVMRQYLDVEVKLSSTSRDGGIDIIAFGGTDNSHRPVLFQCKRYARDKRIGVEVVRSLFRNMEREGTRQGVLVTTSSFTKEAEREIGKTTELARDRWSLSVLDDNALVHWLGQTPSLVPGITAPLDQLRKRYASLVDQKYVSGLSAEEDRERARLAKAIDEADAKFYDPLKKALIRERDRLLKEKAKPSEDL